MRFKIAAPASTGIRPSNIPETTAVDIPASAPRVRPATLQLSRTIKNILSADVSKMTIENANVNGSTLYNLIAGENKLDPSTQKAEYDAVVAKITEIQNHIKSQETNTPSTTTVAPTAPTKPVPAKRGRPSKEAAMTVSQAQANIALIKQEAPTGMESILDNLEKSVAAEIEEITTNSTIVGGGARMYDTPVSEAVIASTPKIEQLEAQCEADTNALNKSDVDTEGDVVPAGNSVAEQTIDKAAEIVSRKAGIDKVSGRRAIKQHIKKHGWKWAVGIVVLSGINLFISRNNKANNTKTPATTDGEATGGSELSRILQGAMYWTMFGDGNNGNPQAKANLDDVIQRYKSWVATNPKSLFKQVIQKANPALNPSPDEITLAMTDAIGKFRNLAHGFMQKKVTTPVNNRGYAPSGETDEQSYNNLMHLSNQVYRG